VIAGSIRRSRTEQGVYSLLGYDPQDNSAEWSGDEKVDAA